VSTIILYIVLFFIAIFILAQIPGVDNFLKNTFEGVFKILAWITSSFTEKLALNVFGLIRGLFQSHWIFIYNLFSPRSKIMPDERIKEINKRGGIQ